MQNRIKVHAPIHQNFDISFFNDSIDNLIKKLKALPEEHRNFLKTLEKNNQNQPKNQRGTIDPTWKLIDEYKFNVEHDWNGDIEVNLTFFRWETTEEVEKRLNTQKKQRASAKQAAIKKKKLEEQKEKELYLKLKEKYETK